MSKLKQIFTKKRIKETLNIALGVLISAFAYTFFLKPNDLVIGGVSGVGVMVKSDTIPWFDSAIMLAINSILLIISLIFIGKEFFMKTIFGSLLFPLCTFLLDYVYKFIDIDFSTLDMMLVIIFSSIIMGYGLAIAMKNGGSTGGTDVLQQLFFEKFHIPYSLTMYVVDGSVILLGFFVLNQHIDLLFYEIIFAVICGMIMDVIIFSGFNKRSVHIISDKADEIKDVLLKDFERGVTSIKVVGEYSKNERKMLICILSSREYNKLREIIEKIDPLAFYYCVRANEVRGEGFSRD